ncbi:MAG TPA: hypothetical protein VGD59_09090 [Acidisarcina sp.]
MTTVNTPTLNESQNSVENTEALHAALQRAEQAEAKLAELQQRGSTPTQQADSTASSSSEPYGSGTHERTYEPIEGEAGTSSVVDATGHSSSAGIEQLRKDSMMAHLLDSLEASKDIGHYGRLVFAMIARHFLSDEEVLGWLTRDPDFSAEQAKLMLRQVEGRDYNPPKRERIVEWQSQQEFPILPDPADPDCGNVYRNLKFPDEVYQHIGHYQEQKLNSEE